jgi:hypothetical protein
MIAFMSSEDEKWGHKAEMTMKEYFNPPLTLPHKGIILLVRELENTGKRRSPQTHGRDLRERTRKINQGERQEKPGNQLP